MTKQSTIVELTETLADLTSQAANALAEGGQYSREYRQLNESRLHIERKLESAKSLEEEKERRANQTPAEIVDRVMRR